MKVGIWLLENIDSGLDHGKTINIIREKEIQKRMCVIDHRSFEYCAGYCARSPTPGGANKSSCPHPFTYDQHSDIGTISRSDKKKKLSYNSRNETDIQNSNSKSDHVHDAMGNSFLCFPPSFPLWSLLLGVSSPAI